jgi:hypothetical protein
MQLFDRPAVQRNGPRPTAVVIPPPTTGESPTFDTTRRSRFAARFAGAGGAISIANSPALEPATFTIKMWVRIESTPCGFTPPDRVAEHERVEQAPGRGARRPDARECM